MPATMRSSIIRDQERNREAQHDTARQHTWEPTGLKIGVSNSKRAHTSPSSSSEPPPPP
eukprot:SAG25_NODE_2453_length_1595_cov_1.450535_1_plen_58_part_10